MSIYPIKLLQKNYYETNKSYTHIYQEYQHARQTRLHRIHTELCETAYHAGGSKLPSTVTQSYRYFLLKYFQKPVSTTRNGDDKISPFIGTSRT
jgi:hypothetical protein